jgi:hypothetical protein
MKKLFLLVLGLIVFKFGYSQYPIQQFIGADSAIVTSKGAMQSRFVNVVFTDTSQANTQRIRQYPGAMIYAAGKMWVRNTTATGWTELAYGPISTTNIYNSNGTLTGNRDLDGGGYNLTFSSIGGEFGVGADSINFVPASGKFRISSLNQGIGSKALRYDPVTKLLSYSDTTSSLNIYNSDGTLTGNRELDGNSNNLTFTAVKKFEFSGDSLYYILDPAGNLRIKLGNQQLTMQGDTASLSRRISYTGNLGSSFTKHSLVDKNYVDSIGVLSPTGSGTTNYVSKWTGSTALGNSQIFDNGTSVGIGTATPSASYLLDVSGASRISGNTYLATTSQTSLNIGSSNFSGTLWTGGSHIFIGSSAKIYGSTGADASIGSNLYFDGSADRRIRAGFVSDIYFDANGDINFRSAGNGTANSTLTATTNAVIKNNGNFLIGSTVDGGFKLSVTGTFRSTLDANINGLTVGKGGGSVSDNTAFGYQAINGTSTGTSNTAIGYIALKSLTSGSYNSALGLNAGNSLTTGNQNVFLGSYAGGSFTTQSNNVAIGYYSMVSATSADFNTAIGHSAFQNTTSAGGGVAVGYQALNANTSGDYNTGIGYQSLRRNTTGAYNTAIGHRTLDAAITATGNTSIGWASLINATGGYNTAIGKNAGYSTTTGTYNIFIGADPSLSSGNGITTGNYNTIIGSQITGLSSSLSNTIILADGQGNQRLYINSSGYAGIGTTSPISRLSNTNTQITDGNNGTSFSGIQWSLSDGGYASAISNTNASATAHGLLVKASGGSPLTVQAGNTTRFVVLQNGNTLIGTTTDAGYKLDVNGTARVSAATGNADFSFSSGGKFRISNNNFASTHFEYNATTATTSIYIFSTNNGNIRSDGSGIFYIGSGQDLRLQSGGFASSNAQSFLIKRNDPNATNAVGLEINDGGATPHANYKPFVVKINSVEQTHFDQYGGGHFGTSTSVSSAILSATSTTKGFLPPRQTQAQRTAITSPAVGLIVYQTDATEGLYIYTSTGWVQL